MMIIISIVLPCRASSASGACRAACLAQKRAGAPCRPKCAEQLLLRDAISFAHATQRRNGHEPGRPAIRLTGKALRAADKADDDFAL